MRISDWISDVCSSDLKELRSLLVVGGRAGAKEQHQADGDESLHVQAPESGLTMLLAPSCAAPRIFPGRHWVKSARTSYPAQLGEIGRASCRERVCQYVSISVGAESRKKTKKRK